MSGFGYNVLGFGANASSAAGEASDDEFNRVSFLSHFDGANNGVNNSFDDGSDSNHTVTAVGNVTQGSFGPFARPDGEWGVSFDGSGDVLKTPSLTIGTGTITYECWLNFNTVAGNTTIVCFNDSDSARVSLYNSDGDLKIYSSANGGRTVKSSAFTTPNSWIKLLLVRASNTATVYLDGTSVGTGTMPENLTGVLAIGAYNGGEIFNGIISNVRLSDNARQSGNYTVETAPLASDSNTDLLTCQSNRFVDNSSNGHTITPTGNPAVTAFGPFLTSAVYDPAVNGASLGSDGSGDYLTIPQTTDMDLPANFTVECWVYLNQVDKTQVFIGKWGGNNKYGWALYVRNNGEFAFFSGNNGNIGTQLLSGVTATAGQWYHIAACRTSSTVSYFVNGVRTATGSDSNDMTVSSTLTYIATDGSATSSNSVNGFLCDARVIKGTAAYDGATYTIPTAPLTAVTNTKLLLNMADGQAIDSAAQNNLTLVGTAKTSTAQYKFGTASLLLDGNSDLVTLPADVGRLSAGNAPIDFTIELAFRLAANVGVTPNSIIARWETSGDQRSWMVRMDNVSSENKIKFFDSSTGSNNASTTFSTAFSSETWYQIALVSASGAVKLYVNGTADSTTHTWTTGTFNAPYDSTALLSIGANVPSSPDNFFNGNIDEVRLSKFARYTSNFTAPTAAFADKGQ